jgi:hypothetical protein
MPSSAPQPLKLLHYLSSYRVVVCKECHYAIQPAAISRHLKELHHIYRGDRQVYLDYALQLDLADPEDVVPPEPHQVPVPFLPIEKGVACEAPGCGHLCVTVKRMKQHWATVHKQLPPNANNVRWHSVNLQTFFRGNQLRYFVVDVKTTPLTATALPISLPPTLPLLELGNLNLNADLLCGESYYRCMLEVHGSELEKVADLDLLHHFMTSTYTSLGETVEAQKAWLSPLIDLAFAQPFLMHGILAIAATHLASISPCSTDRQRYDVAAAQYHGLALPAFRTAITVIDERSCHAVMAFSHILMITTFALDNRNENLFLVRQKGEDELPDWLIVIRGGCTIFHNTMHLISEGPMKPFLQEIPCVTERPGAPHNVDHLFSFPFPESDYSSGSSFHPSSQSSNEPLSMPSSPHLSSEIDLCKSNSWPYNGTNSGQPSELRKQIYLAALQTLREAFLKAHSLGENFQVRTALLSWPANVSQEYLSLLKTRDPSALVLLSHWSVLLKPFEVKWYMVGFPMRLLRYVWSELPAEYRCWLQWPMQELGLSKLDLQH